MNKKVLVIGGLVIVAGLAAICLKNVIRSGGETVDKPTEGVRQVRKTRLRPAAQPAKGVRQTTPAAKTAAKSESVKIKLSPLSEELAEGELTAAIEEILELVNELGLSAEQAERCWQLRKLSERGGDSDRRAALRIAREMRLSKNRRERAEALAALGWAGAQALPELTEMLADEDPELAEQAFDAWMTAFNELGDDSLRCDIIAAAAKAFSNEAHMDAIMLELTRVDRAMAFETIAKILQDGQSTAAGRESAKGIYEHMADSHYTSVDEVLAAAKTGGTKIGDETGHAELMQSLIAERQAMKKQNEATADGDGAAENGATETGKGEGAAGAGTVEGDAGGTTAGAGTGG